MKRWLITAVILLVSMSLAAMLVVQQYQRFLESSLILPADGHVIQIEPGTSGSAIVSSLAGAGITLESWQWKLLMRLEPPAIRAGEYRLSGPMLPRELLQHLASGDVIQYRFTLIEGWTFSQLLEALASNSILLNTLGYDSVESLQMTTRQLGIDHPEGWFFPETYQFTRGDTDMDILNRAHLAMKKALDSAWHGRQENLPLKSDYEMLVMASIIEKETAKDDERNRVAGVFIRRLQKRMRLQTDPTVIYGMGETFDGDIRRRDLKTDTAYNTYTRFGLPPTPIAMPGNASLVAAGQPDDGDALYFVADGSGGHTFSVTLKEHQKAVKKMRNH